MLSISIAFISITKQYDIPFVGSVGLNSMFSLVLVESTIFFLLPRASPIPNFKCTHLKIYNKTIKNKGLMYFLIFHLSPSNFQKILFLSIQEAMKNFMGVS